MSRANAALALPPGDRDDAPLLAMEPQPDHAAAASAPPLDRPPEIERLRSTLDDAQMALGELTLALGRGDKPAAKAAAWRLNEALMADPRTLSVRLRKTVLSLDTTGTGASS